MRPIAAGLRAWMASNCASVSVTGRPEWAIASSYALRVQGMTLAARARPESSAGAAISDAASTSRRVSGRKYPAKANASSILGM